MPITVWLADNTPRATTLIDRAFERFIVIDQQFSTYKPDSQISRINRGLLTVDEAEEDVQSVLRECERLRQNSSGYFDVYYQANRLDPSGYVKGWAIQQVSDLLQTAGAQNYCIDAGGDIYCAGGSGDEGRGWMTGIASPFDDTKVIKQVRLCDRAIATSGTTIRGAHIYDPHTHQPATYLASVSVIGPDICIADVLATTIFAMDSGYAERLRDVLPPGYTVCIVTANGQLFCSGGFGHYEVV